MGYVVDGYASLHEAGLVWMAFVEGECVADDGEVDV